MHRDGSIARTTLRRAIGQLNLRPQPRGSGPCESPHGIGLSTSVRWPTVRITPPEHTWFSRNRHTLQRKSQRARRCGAMPFPDCPRIIVGLRKCLPIPLVGFSSPHSGPCYLRRRRFRHGGLPDGGLHLPGGFVDGGHQLGPVIGEDRDRLLGAGNTDIK